VSDAWWKTAVVYQVWPRSFADSNGDGVGDLPGIVSKLDYLSALGVDVLWVSPFYRSPMDDMGYDVSDYQDVDPVFGILADVDELIAELHARGMKLMLDVVVNHTSDEHPWFVESRSSTDNPKRDWYWWRSARPGAEPGEPGAEPTNWQAAFQGSAWEFDPKTEQYYLHVFSRKQPDLNWENPEVRQAVYAMLRWWLDRGVDGFRMDVINLISKVLPLVDGKPIPGTRFGDGWAHVTCGPRIHEFLHELNREVIAGRDRVILTVGEMPGATLEDAQLFTDPARAEVDMVFQFEHVDLDYGPGGRYDPGVLRLTDLKTSLGRWQSGLAERGWNSLYWDNHDQPRAVSRFGCDDPEYRVRSAKLLATVLHLHRGTPYVFQGEELGMTNFPWTSIDEFRDLDSLNYWAEAVGRGDDPAQVLAALHAQSRDNARTPMQWDGSATGGFTTGTPWIAVNPNTAEINVEAQLEDPDSVLGHYRRLIELRHRLPVVAHGGFTMLLPDDEQVYAFIREHATGRLLVLANFGRDERSVDVPGADDWQDAEVLVSNYADESGRWTLRAWEAKVLSRAGVG
jgi:oligo-1,6-glucosidase